MGDFPDSHDIPDFPAGNISDPQRVDEFVAIRRQLDDRGRPRPWESSHGEDVTDAVETHLGRRAAQDFAHLASRAAIDPDDPDLADRAFASWALVRPSSALRAAAGAGRLPDPIEQYLIVYQDGSEGLLFASGRVTARHPPGMRPEAAIAAEGLTLVHRFRSSRRTLSLAHAPADDPLAVSARLVRTHRFEAAWPELLSISPPQARPGDPYYRRYQWFWRNTGQLVNNVGGTHGADVAAERAWDLTRGRGTVIAMIDDGFAPAHEDLAPAVMPESGYYLSGTGLAAGLTYVRDSVNPTPSGIASHGNLAAGMAAARANTRRGGCGMAPEAGLRLVALPAPRSAEMLARAIDYAVDPTSEPVGAGAGAYPHHDDGADVISISVLPPVAGAEAQALLHTAVHDATQTGRGGLGTLICWTAPNASGSIDANYLYQNRRVCVVAASNSSDRIPRNPLNNLLPNQGFGFRLQFVAPGHSVFNTWTSSYYRDSGCSYATPVVSGLAALVLTVNPELAWHDVRQVIRDGCDKIESWRYSRGFNRACGFGRVNAGRTVARVADDVSLRGL